MMTYKFWDNPEDAKYDKIPDAKCELCLDSHYIMGKYGTRIKCPNCYDNWAESIPLEVKKK